MSPEVPESIAAFPVTPEVLRHREFRLGPDDIVRSRVYGHEELSTPHSDQYEGSRVDPDGNLSLPLIGNIHVEGMTVAEARGKVEEALAEYMKEPKVEFSLLKLASRYFYIYGEVEKPGLYPMERPLNFYEALTFGAGFRSTAMRNEIVLLRQGEDEVEMFVLDGEELDPVGLMDIRSGDLIFVMRSGSGRFHDEILPIIYGVSSSMAAVASTLLIEDRIND